MAKEPQDTFACSRNCHDTWSGLHVIEMHALLWSYPVCRRLGPLAFGVVGGGGWVKLLLPEGRKDLWLGSPKTHVTPDWGKGALARRR